MQRVGIIAFLHQLVSYFLRFFAGTAEDDAVYLRIVVHNTFQGSILVFGMYTEGYVFHVAGAFIFASDGDFLGIAQVLLGDACDFRAHGSGEQQGVALLRHIGENGVDAVCESHVQHFVRFVHNHVLYGGEGHGFAFHQVQQSSRCGYDDVYTPFQGAYLAFDGRASIYGQHSQAIGIFRIIVQVACYLQTKFAGGAENK